MKLEFGKRFKSIRALVEVVGPVDYLTLLTIGERHGLKPEEVFGQLEAELAEGTVSSYRPYQKDITLFQSKYWKDKFQASKERRAAVGKIQVTDEMADRVNALIDQVFSNYTKFRVSEVKEALFEKEEEPWCFPESSGPDGALFDKFHIEATLNRLVKSEEIVVASKGRSGTWFSRPDYDKSLKPKKPRKSSED